MVPPNALELAGEVSHLLTERGVRTFVIGAIALAAHGYVRGTADVDLAIALEPRELQALAAALRDLIADVEVTVEMPSSDDPLGGVIDVRRASDRGILVQIVNFDNSPGGGFPALVREARTEPFEFSAGRSGALVSAEDLVFFKLYASGNRNHVDIQELLARRQIDVARLEALARRYRMEPQLSAVLGKPSR